MLILCESQSIQSIIESLIQEKGKDYVFYNGSQFYEDQKSEIYNLRMITKIQQAAEEGKVLCLSDLDYLYPSYYDVFNQNYLIREGKKYAKVGLYEKNQTVEILSVSNSKLWGLTNKGWICLEYTKKI